MSTAHTENAVPTRQIPFLCQLVAAAFAQLGVQSAWCTPRKSHVELRARKCSENVTYYLCGAHHTDGTSNAICVVYTTQMQSMWCTPLECDLLGAHRTNRPMVQSMWCTPLECELRGAHRTRGRDFPERSGPAAGAFCIRISYVYQRRIPSRYTTSYPGSWANGATWERRL